MKFKNNLNSLKKINSFNDLEKNNFLKKALHDSINKEYDIGLLNKKGDNTIENRKKFFNSIQSDISYFNVNVKEHPKGEEQPYYDLRGKEIFLGPKDFNGDTDIISSAGHMIHETMHLFITKGVDNEKFIKFVFDKEKPGFSRLFNIVEDIRINNVANDVYPNGSELIKYSYIDIYTKQLNDFLNEGNDFDGYIKNKKAQIQQLGKKYAIESILHYYGILEIGDKSINSEYYNLIETNLQLLKSAYPEDYDYLTQKMGGYISKYGNYDTVQFNTKILCDGFLNDIHKDIYEKYIDLYMNQDDENKDFQDAMKDLLGDNSDEMKTSNEMSDGQDGEPQDGNGSSGSSSGNDSKESGGDGGGGGPDGDKKDGMKKGNGDDGNNLDDDDSKNGKGGGDGGKDKEDSLNNGDGNPSSGKGKGDQKKGMKGKGKGTQKISDSIKSEEKKEKEAQNKKKIEEAQKKIDDMKNKISKPNVVDEEDFLKDFIKDNYDKEKHSMVFMINNAINKFRQALKDKRLTKIEKNINSGNRLNSNRLVKNVIGNKFGSLRKDQIFNKAFERRKAPGKIPDYYFSIIIDQSGSMTGERLATAKKSGIFLMEVLKSLKTPFSLYGYSDYYEKLYGFDDRGTNKYRDITNMETKGGTRELPVLNAVESDFKKLDSTKGKKGVNKVVFLITDGESYRETYEKVKDLNKKGINVYGIGIGSGVSEENLKETYGKYSVKCNELKDLTPKLVNILQDIYSI